MSGLNKVQIIGYLGKDPEFRADVGEGLLKFSVAVSEKFKTRSGEQKETTEWFDVSVWGKRAVALSEFLKKGSRVYVEGPRKTTIVEGDDGKKRYFYELTCRELVMLDGKRPAGEQSDATGDESGDDDFTV